MDQLPVPCAPNCLMYNASVSAGHLVTAFAIFPADIPGNPLELAALPPPLAFPTEAPLPPSYPPSAGSLPHWALRAATLDGSGLDGMAGYCCICHTWEVMASAGGYTDHTCTGCLSSTAR